MDRKEKSMTSRIGAFVATLLVLASTASAHHNMSAIFDFNDRVTLTGTLSTLESLCFASAC